jgi:ribosomal protein L37AE/L43A
MPSVIERASTGRAKCRACGQAIARGDERFGEALPNAYGEGDSLFWFHLPCAAHARPEALLPVLAQSALSARERQPLEALAQAGVAQGRLCRILRAERASSGRARCRHCRELIDQGVWRLSLQIFEEGRFSPIGTIHATCAVGYFGSEPALARLTLPNNQLHPDELSEIQRLMREGAAQSLQIKGLAKAGGDESEVESTRKSS